MEGGGAGGQVEQSDEADRKGFCTIMERHQFCAKPLCKGLDQLPASYSLSVELLSFRALCPDLSWFYLRCLQLPVDTNEVTHILQLEWVRDTRRTPIPSRVILIDDLQVLEMIQ